ncbi:hypothetical protein Pla52n_08330 [Stieleria varia]|uniref:Uncharacterized protein n=1 Tax=Stieleria varia TaxID=2528005 RepID=A0A5C6B9Z1_9BACT|nr:hypothetical protein Pla52n_08330 [Stieleria varia]
MEALPRENQRSLEIVIRSAGRSLLIIGFPGRSLGTSGASGGDQRDAVVFPAKSATPISYSSVAICSRTS